MDQRDQYARAAAADRMAQGAGTAVDVDLVVRQAVLVHGGHRDGGERLVDFEQVDLGGTPAGAIQGLFHRAHRRRGEPLRLLRMSRMGVDSGEWLKAPL